MAKRWTKKTYEAEAREFVACYGVDYGWAEFVDEYMQLFQESDDPAPDADELYDAILKENDAVKARSKGQAA